MASSKIMIVTGAGSGVGRAVSIMIAQAGYDLTLVGRTQAKLEDTAKLIDAQAMIVTGDLADPATCKQVIDQTIGEYGYIGAIANIAGAAPSLQVADVTPEIWRNCVDTNLSAIVHLTAAAWSTFTKQQNGMIVNVSSLASFDPFPGLGIYAAVKAGVNMFTRVTAEEGKEIRLNAVCIAPGAIETPMLRAIFDEKTIPADRTLSPQQVAQLICDCITGKRRFKPGETISLPSP